MHTSLSGARFLFGVSNKLLVLHRPVYDMKAYVLNCIMQVDTSQLLMLPFFEAAISVPLNLCVGDAVVVVTQKGGRFKVDAVPPFFKQPFARLALPSSIFVKTLSPNQSLNICSLKCIVS